MAAADGFARAGNRLGIATVTHGPGLTNALTALVTARRARSPLLLVSGNASFYSGPSTQRLDHKSAVEALVVNLPFRKPAPDGDWTAAVEEAIDLTRDGAVLLDLPAPFMRQPARSGGPPAPTRSAPMTAPYQDIVRLAVKLLADSHRVVIIAGRGAVRAGVRDALIELSRRYGALIGTSLPANGLFHGFDGDIGIVGGLASRFARAACSQCDALIVAGASLNGFTTIDGKLFRSAKSSVSIAIGPRNPRYRLISLWPAI